MAFKKKLNVAKYLIPCIAFLLPVLLSSNVFADSLATSGFDLYYIPVSGNNYTWRNGMLYNQTQQVYQAQRYQFYTPSVTATGTNAVIHFETNIVASQPAHSSGINQSHFVNLDYITNLSCSASNGNLSIIGSSISYARTPWFSNNNLVFNETLTLYGDIALKGFNKDTSGSILCAVGSDNFAFYDSQNRLSTSYTLYFEQNPMSIVWTDNNTDNLLQQQISQTQQLIYQNQQLYNQNEQNTQNIINNQSDNTQDIIDNQNQNTQDIIKSNQSCHQSVNLFNGVLETGLINGETGQNLANSSYMRSKDYIPVSEVTTYTLSAKNYPSSAYYYWYEYRSDYSYNLTQNKTSRDGTFTTNPNTAYVKFRFVTDFTDLTTPVQLQQGFEATPFEPYGEEICKNVNQEYYDEQRQADQNIANQSTSDIDGATNAQTTSLIGTIQNFVTALGSIQTGSCQLTLPFPQFIGGDTVVNPCSGKEKAPAIISIGSSMLLIGVFIPLAFIVLKMIYNEIRSFTNG